MSRMISETVKRLFANDFEEFQPVKKHWWQKIDFSHLQKKEGLVAALAAVVIILGGVYYYNKFIGLSRFTEMEQHQIEVQLQRKRNLAINLAKMVIAYAEHERTMYEYVADRQTGSSKKKAQLLDAIKNSGLDDLTKMKIGNVDSSFTKLLALAEAYPDLKLSDNFQKLMDALIESENRIANSRMEYNKAASIFHAAVREVPACFYAFIFGYHERMFHYAEVDQDVNKPVLVQYRVFNNPDAIQYQDPGNPNKTQPQKISKPPAGGAKVSSQGISRIEKGIK